MYWFLGLFHPRCRTLHMSLLNFTRSLPVHVSSLTRSLWLATWPSGESATPSSFVSSRNLLRVRSTPRSRLLMNMLKRIRHRLDPQCTSLIAGLQLDFVPITTILRAQPLSQFLIHHTVWSSCSYFNCISMMALRGDVKCLTEVPEEKSKALFSSIRPVISLQKLIRLDKYVFPLLNLC